MSNHTVWLRPALQQCPGSVLDWWKGAATLKTLQKLGFTSWMTLAYTFSEHFRSEFAFNRKLHYSHSPHVTLFLQLSSDDHFLAEKWLALTQKLRTFYCCDSITENVQPVTLFWPDPPDWNFSSFSDSPPGNLASWRRRTACLKRMRLITVLKEILNKSRKIPVNHWTTGFNICFWQFYGRFVSVLRQLTAIRQLMAVTVLSLLSMLEEQTPFFMLFTYIQHVHIAVCRLLSLFRSFNLV